MTDEPETPLFPTEALAPTHEPAPVPPAETIKPPSGEVVPLRVVCEDVEYPVEVRAPTNVPTEAGGAEDADGEDYDDEHIVVMNQADVVDTIFDTHGAVAALLRVTEELATTLRLHGVALNEILHALRPEPVERSLRDMVKGWPEPKAKVKAKPKAKPKAKAKAKVPAKRARR